MNFSHDEDSQAGFRPMQGQHGNRQEWGRFRLELPSSGEAVSWEGFRKAQSASGQGEELVNRDIWGECPRSTPCSSVKVKERSLLLSPEPWAESVVSFNSDVSTTESPRDNGEGPSVEAVSPPRWLPLFPPVSTWGGKSCSCCCAHWGLIQAALCLMNLMSDWQGGWSMSRRLGEPSMSPGSLLSLSHRSTGESCRPVDCDTIFPGSGWCESCCIIGLGPWTHHKASRGPDSLSAMSKNHSR